MDAPRNSPGHDHSEQERRRLIRDTILGVLSLFSCVTVAQAVLNIFTPTPRIWPASLALVVVLVTVVWWRATRQR